MFKNLFKKSQNKTSIKSIEEIFNVTNFNNWFINPDNGSYANHGIFLRLDKLCDSFFFEYFEFQGVKKGSDFAYNENYTKFRVFVEQVRLNWISKINEKNS